MPLIYPLLINLVMCCSYLKKKKECGVLFGWAGSFHLFILLTKSYSAEQNERGTVSFSLKCLFNAQPNELLIYNGHSKYRCKAILQGEFPRLQSAHSARRVKWAKLKWQKDVSNKQPLASPELPLCSSLLLGQRRKGKTTQCLRQGSKVQLLFAIIH